MFRIIILIVMLIPTVVWGQSSSPSRVGKSAPGEKVAAASQSRWGQIPARADSSAAKFADRPRPGWEKVAMVPYNIVGIPFRVLDFVGHESLKAADRLGFFGLPPAEHLGLPLPLDIYLMPDFGISGLEGTTYGLSLTRYDFLGPENRLYLTASSSTRHADKYAGGTIFQLTSRSGIQLGAGYSELPLTKYYGLGPTSERDDLSYYNRRSWWAGLEGDYDAGRKVGVEFRGYFSRVEAADSRYEVHQGLGDVHQDNLPPGFPGDSEGWTWRLGLVRKTTSETGRPEEGGFQKASVALFTASDGSNLDFMTYTLDVQHFIPLWYTKRSLGLRVFFNRISNLGDYEVPLTRLITFSRPDELRGFSSLRFYGLGSLGFSAEYRWPVWVSRGREGPGLDAYLFSDVGQVYMDTSEIALANLEYTGGFGFRFIGLNQNFIGRFELGFSDEETVVTLKLSQNFQYDAKGMLGGKDPTRRR